MGPRATGGAPSTGPVRISKSAITTFRMCRLRWMYQYVVKRPHDRPEPESAALARGVAGHQAIASIITLERAGGASDEEASVLIDHAMRQHDVRVMDRVALAQAVRSSVTLTHDRAAEAIAIERMMRRPLNGSQSLLTGRVDLVLRRDPQTIEVIDWTFGRSRVATADDLRASAAWALYAQIAWHELRPKRMVLTEVSLLPSPFVVSIEVAERGDLAEGTESLGQVRREMEQAVRDGDVTPTAGLHCGHCPYGPACPVGAPMPGMVHQARARQIAA